jgi:Tfp pilus assembly protein PilV
VEAFKSFAGFTLTEVVVASGLLIIAVVPILKALTIAQATSITIDRKTRSLVLAQGKLEEIRARSIYHYMNSFDESSVSLSGSYLCNVSDNEHPSLRTITVSIGYDVNGDSNLSSGEILVTLTTYVAKRWPAS